MTVTPLFQPQPDAAALAEIERLRASDALGPNGRLRELFEFLVERSAEGRPPKEAEIAMMVFGKPDADASRDDPVARVYIHRLRKRLDDFYIRDKSPSGLRLTIPKGEYRLVAEPASKGPEGVAETLLDDAGSALQPPSTVRPRMMATFRVVAAVTAIALLLLANLAAWLVFTSRPADPNAAVRNSPIWTSLANSKQPLLIVVGDDYIFGEYENRLFLKRLIRDFSINSKDDLVRTYMNDPKQFDRFSDVALRYLPTSSAFALADITPLFEDGRPVEVVLASELTPDRLKTGDIIYIGLLSGMGALRDPVFARSRFVIGENYDQIVDRESGRSFNSEAFLAAPSDTMYRDYGFFSSFAGPSGNRIAIVSGTRDTALMGVAEAMTRLPTLQEFDKAIKTDGDFEALFEVKGQKHVNLQTRVLASASIDSPAIWTGERTNPATFPHE